MKKLKEKGYKRDIKELCLVVQSNMLHVYYHKLFNH